MQPIDYACKLGAATLPQNGVGHWLVIDRTPQVKALKSAEQRRIENMAPCMKTSRSSPSRSITTVPLIEKPPHSSNAAIVSSRTCGAPWIQDLFYYDLEPPPVATTVRWCNTFDPRGQMWELYQSAFLVLPWTS
jgi:hypothetical protein